VGCGGLSLRGQIQLSACRIRLGTTQAMDDIFIFMLDINRLGTDQLGGTTSENSLEVLVVSKLDKRQLHALAAKKSKNILGCVSNSIAGELSEEIIPICSALIRPCLEHCIQFWDLQYKKDMD